MAKLVVREGRNVGAEYKIPEDRDRIVLGRKGTCDFQVLDPKASREHTEIRREEEKLFLRDLGSRNSTVLNGQPALGEVELEFGDLIKIGDTVLEVVDDTAAEPISVEIPGYEMMNRIGRGGMGVVYRARQVSMDRVVALKVLNERYSSNELFVNRFIREARAAGRLNHPNVIHVHDVNKTKDNYYFSMEFVDGTNVKKMLKKEGRIPVDKGLDIVLQAAKALNYAHEQGVIHRDVKPDNIMVTSDGVVKLADLGIAKTFDERGERDGRRVLGTPHYMAPEQALGKDVDARADIYSLGATFYHMLTGSTPFQGRGVTEVLKAHIQTSLPPIQEKAPEVPESVVRIVERMMAKTPQKRYASMGKAIEDLGRVQADREADIEALEAGASSIMPAVKRAKGAARAARRPRKKSALAQGLTVAVILAALGVLFVGTVLVTRNLIEPGGEPARLLDRAREHLAAGEIEEARALIDRILDSFPAGTEEARAARALLAETRDLGVDVAEEPELDLDKERAKVSSLREKGDLEGALSAAADLFAALAEDDEGRDTVDALIQGLQDELTTKRAKEAQEQFAAYQSYLVENPGDEEGQLRRLKAIVDLYGGTGVGVKARTLARELESRLRERKAEEARTDFSAARSASEAAASRRDYDRAIQAYSDFLVKHGDSGPAADAKAATAALEKEIAAVFAERKQTAQGQLAGKQYGRALSTARNFVQGYGSTKWRGEADRLLADLERKIDEAFEAEHAGVKAMVLAMAYDDAASQYSLLANRFRNTRKEAFARKRLGELAAEKAVFAELLRRINGDVAANGPRQTDLLPPGIPEAMKKQRWHFYGAREGEITFGIRDPVQPMTRPVPWGTLPPEDLIKVYDVYFPNPTPEEGLAISYLCEERDLAGLAASHRGGTP